MPISGNILCEKDVFPRSHADERADKPERFLKIHCSIIYSYESENSKRIIVSDFAFFSSAQLFVFSSEFVSFMAHFLTSRRTHPTILKEFADEKEWVLWGLLKTEFSSACNSIFVNQYWN
jgi:hypothetical protein